ncbi:MAG: hypothetical protein KC476_07765 [Cyanobacteria bacterium HKST-UBA06]|nr:hypothetical protein [Cyanobacteria bacterium HKST-UBA05]MCA9798249.1 hypothetical protein [Cyanobacteria bacterium HKST-UBA04]MCA9807836.1 hypothetical protein [Cyanobacteria bacterium HKST-UBA06]MCA9841188.1 hypothetical protein [Cyanobacteria bacterium HKST-UBA03]
MGCCDHKPHGGGKPTMLRLLVGLIGGPLVVALFILHAMAAHAAGLAMPTTQPLVEIEPNQHAFIQPLTFSHPTPFLSCDKDGDNPLNDAYVVDNADGRHRQPMLMDPATTPASEESGDPLWHSIPFQGQGLHLF